MKKLFSWMKKWIFLWVLLLTGSVYLTGSGEWRVYAEPVGEWRDRIAGTVSEETAKGPTIKEETAKEETAKVPEEDGITESAAEAAPEGAGEEPPEEPSGEAQTAVIPTPEEEEPQTIGEAGEEEEPADVWVSVEDDYFDNSLFIGDSRTAGLYKYGGLEERADFYASVGLTIFKLFDSRRISVVGQREKLTLEEVLSEKQYESIYLMLGINEMGTGTLEDFVDAYQEVLTQLRALQPDAVIYVQSILKVTEKRSKQGDYITNEGIDLRNEALAQLADNETVYFLDINSILCDETGGMAPEWTSDGVHPKAQFIPCWTDFLKSHVAQQVVLD